MSKNASRALWGEGTTSCGVAGRLSMICMRLRHSGGGGRRRGGWSQGWSQEIRGSQ